MAPLEGKTAIVTGASRGLGAGMALELARNGASAPTTPILTHPATTSHSRQPGNAPLHLRLQRLQSRRPHLPNHLPPPPALRGSLQSRPLLRDGPSAVLSALDAWLGPAARVDILVNNAGTELHAPLGSISPADFAKVYDVNVRAPLLLTQALLPRLAPSDARIINVGSVGGRQGFPGLGLYCSSKAALEGLTRVWARELGGNGTTSDMLDNIPKELVDMQKRQTPVQNRVGTADEVARVVAWLASPESSWVSGQVISASGGGRCTKNASSPGERENTRGTFVVASTWRAAKAKHPFIFRVSTVV
ncbi:LOW QUALITY PROTEIN: 3-ketoacyl-acyl carrier protein reductase [Colletotrichum tofieldiae]|nr:LOW QUALITY PROTEIN: 3-ketoacyl-acyl carrier protein reductase [Colletotrichum tofieldiae]